MPGLPTGASVVPRSTWHDFHVLYDIGAEPEGHPTERPEIRMAYHRPVMIQHTLEYASRFIAAVGIQPASSARVLVIGGGFGFLAEILRDNYGLANERVATIDPSVYITGAKDETEEADINALIVGVGINLADDYGKMIKGTMFDGGVRCRTRFLVSRLENQSAANTVKSSFPSSAIDYVITDDGYLNYHNDAEIADILDAVGRLGAGQIWHLVYSTWGNGKPLSTWKSLRPSHRYYEWESGNTA